MMASGIKQQQQHQEIRTQPKVTPIPLNQKLMVGALAGMTGTLTIFPIDLVKTRWQVSPPGTFKNPWYVAKSIYAERNSIKSFYQNRGLAANLLFVGPEKALKLAVNEQVRQVYTNPITGEIQFQHELLAGSTAGFVQVIVTNPMEIVKIHLQVNKDAPKPMMDIIRSLGPRGLYTAIHCTWARDVTFSLVFFPLYANLKKITPWRREDGTPSFGSSLLAGTAAGAIASGLVTPADMVKTILQHPTPRYKNVGESVREITRDKGFTALYKGAVPRMCVVGPLFGITLLAFEIQKSYFEGRLK
jgi:hypothetical protein